MIRRSLLIFIAFFIIAAVINLPLAVLAIPSPSASAKASGLELVVNVFDDEALARGWPLTPPPPPEARDSTPADASASPDSSASPNTSGTSSTWPEVTQWSQEGSYFHRRRQAWSLNQSARTTHQMEVELYGWPLPALRSAA